MIYPGVQKIIDILKNVDNGPTSELGFDMNYEADQCQGSSHPCGSACCIGGHAAIALNAPKMKITTALELLCEIPHKDAYEICWPHTQDVDYESVTLEEAINVLEYYRDTGIVDWNL